MGKETVRMEKVFVWLSEMEEEVLSLSLLSLLFVLAFPISRTF